MYREPDPAPRCASCGGASLSPRAKFELSRADTTDEVSSAQAQIVFRKRGVAPLPRTSMWRSDIAVWAIDRARVCLDCGHVMLCFSDEVLAKVRAAMAGYEPDLSS